jgi:hypothetical protein
VAEGLVRYLFFPGATLECVAHALHCSRWTVGRWIGWVSKVVAVSTLLRLIEHLVDAPVVPLVLDVCQLRGRAIAAAKRLELLTAAQVLCVIEAVAQAARLTPPGISSAVEGAIDGRYRVTTYANPLIPDFAQCPLWKVGHL